MTLYEIDQELLSFQDPETGEINEDDLADFLDLQEQREKKLENIACWVKNLMADAKAIKEEIDRLTERKRLAERKAESLKRRLSIALDGQKFQTPRCLVGFRKTASVNVTDTKAFEIWAKENGCIDFLRYKEPEVSKKDVLAYLKEGYEAPGVSLEEGLSIQVK